MNFMPRGRYDGQKWVERVQKCDKTLPIVQSVVNSVQDRMSYNPYKLPMKLKST